MGEYLLPCKEQSFMSAPEPEVQVCPATSGRLISDCPCWAVAALPFPLSTFLLVPSQRCCLCVGNQHVIFLSILISTFHLRIPGNRSIIQVSRLERAGVTRTSICG